LVVNVDLALSGRLEARQHAQQSRLAAARRPQQREELAALDFQVHVVDGVHRAKMLRDAADRDDAPLVHAHRPSRIPIDLSVKCNTVIEADVDVLAKLCEEGFGRETGPELSHEAVVCQDPGRKEGPPLQESEQAPPNSPSNEEMRNERLDCET
jgi:hypothetical protein